LSGNFLLQLDLYEFVVESDVTVDNIWSASATATVYVNVLDVNDNAPVFNATSLHVASIVEDAPVGTTVAAVTATDVDAGKECRVSLL
jgi:hypothetical protein